MTNFSILHTYPWYLQKVALKCSNSLSFDFKEKYSSRLCETWQAGSFPSVHPFDKLFYCNSKSHDSHLPCNGQNVSLKMGNARSNCFRLVLLFFVAPSKGFKMLPFDYVHVLSETVN